MNLRTAEGQKRHLEQLEATTLTATLTKLGSIADALAEKGVGSERIENLALIAIEHGHKAGRRGFATRPGLSTDDEWTMRQLDAVDEAEAKFAGIINYIVELRDGKAPKEED